MGTWQGALGLQEGNLAWLRHEAFGLEVANHLGAFAGGEFAVDVDEALAVGLEDGDDLLAVVDLELGDKFAVNRRVASGQKKAVGIALAPGQNIEDLFLVADLFPPEPVETSGKTRQQHGRHDANRDAKEPNIRVRYTNSGGCVHMLISITQLCGKSKRT